VDEILQQILNSGPVGIVSAAIVYLIITLQRNSTKKHRDVAQETLETRITLLEADNKMLHTQLDTIGTKLDKIIDQLADIRVSLANKKDKE
jgi:uncharacterized membrane protein